MGSRTVPGGPLRMTEDQWVQGYCPLGCGPTLHRNDQDMIVCRKEGCPQPTAVSSIIADRESEHVVTFEPAGFTVRHPLRERLDDELIRCLLHEYLALLPGPPKPPGRYRMVLDPHKHSYS